MKLRFASGLFIAVIALFVAGTAVHADDLVRDEIIEAREGKETHFSGLLLELDKTVAPTQMVVRQSVNSEGSVVKDWIVKIEPIRLLQNAVTGFQV